MSHTLITRNEIEDLCEGELQSKFSAIMNDLIRTLRWQAERTMALWLPSKPSRLN